LFEYVEGGVAADGVSSQNLNVLILLLSVAGILDASSMKDVFENVNAQSVIDFIKEIHFYHEL